MEVVIFLLICVFIVWITNKDDQGTTTHRSYPPEIPNTLRINVSEGVFNTGENLLPILEVSTCGVFPRFINDPEFRIRMLDVSPASSANGKPILASLEPFQKAGSKNLEAKIRVGDSLPAGSGSVELLKIGGVPKEILVFPEKGSRTIKVILDVVDLATNTKVLSAETTFSITAPSGYLEEEKDESRAHAASLQLAMCIAAEDGKVDDVEVEVIKKWGDRSVNILSGSAKTQRREILNQSLTSVTEKLKKKESVEAFNHAAGVLNRLGESRYKFDAYELCLKVLQADGIAHPAEMVHLTKMVRALNLEQDRVRVLTDRYTENVTFAQVAGAEVDDDAHLGILPEMSKEEIRKHLNKLFKKYSARAAHDDPEIAAKAKGWLEKVGNARARHIK